MNNTVMTAWATSEFGTANFNDARLTNRLIKLADHFGNIPESPINQACGTWSETKAAYRFFKNEKVETAEILSTHIANTIARCEAHKTVLSIQDTSYICYSNHDKTTGLGMITKKSGSHSSTRCSVWFMPINHLTEQIKTEILEQKKIAIIRTKSKYSIYFKSNKDEQTTHIELNVTDKKLIALLKIEDFSGNKALDKKTAEQKKLYTLVYEKIVLAGGYINKIIETKGLAMHTAFAVSPDGLPLGLLDQKIYSRLPIDEEIETIKAKSHGNGVCIEDKESIRWLESLNNTSKSVDMDKTQIITVCDREADMYDFFEFAASSNSLFLVRASQDRNVNKKSLYSKKNNQKLWNVVENFPCHGTIDIQVPAKDNNVKRTAQLEVKFGEFTMNPPRNNFRNKEENLPNLLIYAIYVVEKFPPPGIPALEWLLLTNIAINNFDEAVEKVRWYCLRWRIETFHKILKTGLRVEYCRLGTAERLIRYLTIMSIIAWRIFFITLIARVEPDLPCTDLLDEEEFKVLYAKMSKKKFSTAMPTPTIKEAILWVAQLGGYLARRNDPPPGPMALWRGWKRLFDLTDGWNLANAIN